MKTFFTCFHPHGSRVVDGWMESCRECRECRAPVGYGVASREFWRPAFRTQEAAGGFLVSRCVKGLPYRRVLLCDV